MPIVDNVELDVTNEEFNQAAHFVSNTDQVIFLTGKAGTGKTTFLKYIKVLTDKNTVVLAPTGVAAINAGGATIHSFFQVPFGPFVDNDKRLRTRKDKYDEDEKTIYTTFKYNEDKINIIKGLELLIIDEISMVRCDMLDVIDKLLRVFRRKPSQPFGGVQVILIGDVFQLPPIANDKNNEWQILSQFYESRFFFSSRIMRSLIIEKKYVHFELKKIYRQNEQEFIDLLNRVRVNQVIDSDIQLLRNKYDPAFQPNEKDNFIILATHNFQVEQTNKTKLDELKTELKTFVGEVSGEFPKDLNGNFILPTELNLQLKEGAQVMILKNDAGIIKRYYNGKIGKIKSLLDNIIVVEFENGSNVPIEKATWNYIEYTWNKEKKKVEERIKGTFTQYPLRLAWAITVHKSQGLTFEKVIADLGAAFEDGQVYVALSRCTTLSGLQLKTEIPRGAIRANLKAIEFAKNETPGTLITQQLSEGKADFYYKKAREAIKANDFPSAFEYFTTAKKFRNEIETDVFKRYIISKLTNLAKYKTFALNLRYDLKKRETEIEKLVETIEALKSEKNKREKTSPKLNNSPNLPSENTKLSVVQLDCYAFQKIALKFKNSCDDLWNQVSIPNLIKFQEELKKTETQIKVISYLLEEKQYNKFIEILKKLSLINLTTTISTSIISGIAIKTIIGNRGNLINGEGWFDNAGKGYEVLSVNEQVDDDGVIFHIASVQAMTFDKFKEVSTEISALKDDLQYDKADYINNNISFRIFNGQKTPDVGLSIALKMQLTELIESRNRIRKAGTYLLVKKWAYVKQQVGTVNPLANTASALPDGFDTPNKSKTTSKNIVGVKDGLQPEYSKVDQAYLEQIVENNHKNKELCIIMIEQIMKGIDEIIFEQHRSSDGGLIIS